MTTQKTNDESIADLARTQTNAVLTSCPYRAAKAPS